MIINLVGFQICWLGLVFWGNSFIPFAITLLLFHFSFSTNKRQELKLILSVLVLGAATDIFLSSTSVFVFESSVIIPPWLLTLWCCFAATLLHSLRILKQSKVLQIIAGAIFAPLSYIAGYKLNAVDFSFSTQTTYLILSFIWAHLMVIFFKLADVFEEETHAA